MPLHQLTYLHEFKGVIRVPSVGVYLIVEHVAHVDETRGERERERESTGEGRVREVRESESKRKGRKEKGWSGGGKRVGDERKWEKKNITHLKEAELIFGRSFCE